ncbi:serine/threonine protein kinase [Labedella gwakjiensis]|uniref:non-specific serine/threonine protein kinase n=1 Tax=Labedella gwakjiensis TaxID=390269 RepID=A0A2P8GS22_9MICO|nr:serine/threonine-protein kinase [Labedella gwakjiensis]PSL36770.1 serine/threonine protein kinase [Labedella gwakjiensis]RUQ84283.1 serine/threonine protein kinase [Labedella gwakjiensis]
MNSRLPSAPPVLPGFTFSAILGSGGFADVFLYEQDAPRRQVAVKVMLSGYADKAARDVFRAEADLMAQLSTHPAILTVHQSGVSADGRPYLVMEMCPTSVGDRYRDHPLSVADVLRIGIKIAGAAESAHRAGVLHRDIKPSNILQTVYGNPVLSDFGIAAVIGTVAPDSNVGLSVPWSAPEIVSGVSTGGISSEVWSLGATVYSLLAGRSPFEQPGGENSPADLMTRIARAKLPPLGRPDVPERLHDVLRRAMSRRPEARQSSALEFARELQMVEAELGIAQTHPDIAIDGWARAAVSDPADRTRANAIRQVDPGRRPRKTRTSPSDVAPVEDARTVVRESLGSRGRSTTGVRDDQRRGSRRRTAVIAVSAAVVVLAAAVATVVLTGDRGDGTIPVVSDIAATVEDGTAVFSWTSADTVDGDNFVIMSSDGNESTQRTSEYRIDGTPGDSVCITVAVRRSGRLGEPSAEKCVQLPDGSG